jgi:23S rRNA pseudouridine1911/1915/1917 synthase
MESSAEQSGHPPRRLVDALVERFPQSSKQTLKRMVEQGRVFINSERAMKLTEVVTSSDQIRIDERPKARMEPSSLAPLELIFEDRDFLIINKPAGLLTSTVPNEKRATALANIQKNYAKTDPKSQIGLIHRLDRDASGLLVFSKNDLAYESLKTQFFHHTVQRVYHAAVHGSPQPPAGSIESRLVEYVDGTVHTTKATGKGQIAKTHYELRRQKGKISEVRIRLETGRKHQIRVHLAARGWPIVGDLVYGRPDGAARLMLAAVELGFAHPRTKKPVTFSIPVPAELDALIQ